MMFTTKTQAKDLNGLRYENMTNLTTVTIRIVEENSLKLITMKTLCNWLHSYYSQFTLHSKFYFIIKVILQYLSSQQTEVTNQI